MFITKQDDPPPRWRIAVIGAGAIGSAAGMLLGGAGHDVTMVVRNADRRASIDRDGLLGKTGRAAVQRVDVRTSATLEDDYDLVVVAVQRQQLDELVATLAANGSRRFAFMLNNASDAGTWDEVLGAGRVLWAFPAILAEVEDGIVAYRVVPKAVQATTVGRADGALSEDVALLRAILADAGVPSVVTTTMDGWLKTHAAVVAPMVAASFLPGRRGRGPRLTWSSSTALAAAVQTGLASVRGSGAPVAPATLRVLDLLPRPALAAGLHLVFATSAGKGLVDSVSDSIAVESAVLLRQLADLAVRAEIDPRPLVDLAAVISARHH